LTMHHHAGHETGSLKQNWGSVPWAPT